MILNQKPSISNLYTFTESGLVFTFPKNWSVIKSDDHRFYNYVSGTGLKSVDFIALDGTKHMYLIEVKNYKDRFEDNGRTAMEPILANPKDFTKKIIQKFEDSLQLIRVIHKYYRRKFWFRRIQSFTLQGLRKRTNIPTNWKYWLASHDILTGQEKSITFILFIELDDDLTTAETANFMGQTTEYLRQHYENQDRKVLVLNTKSENTGFDVQFE